MSMLKPLTQLIETTPHIQTPLSNCWKSLIADFKVGCELEGGGEGLVLVAALVGG